MADGAGAEKREYTEEEAREIWTKAREMSAAGNSDFTEWCFPNDPDERGFSEVTFVGGVVFSKATFEGEAWFTQGTFEGEANFLETTFEKNAYLGEATFKGNAKFWGATFKEYADFGEATFKRIAGFREATFERYADFKRATFEGEADFMEARFTRNTSFAEATFKGDARFLGAKASGVFRISLPWDRPRPFKHQQDGETAYRLAKQVAQNGGNYRDVGNYHYAEQCAINARHRKGASRNPRKLRFWWGEGSWFWSHGTLLIGRWLFGYGERLRGIVITALAVLLLCSCIYWIGGIAGVDGNGAPTTVHRFWASLYFSIVTFTTLGYGDLKPVEGLRLVAGAEALTGAALMALFIVALARKFTR